MAGYLHFSLGPVQGFVAQARRTRDFWAGSFLLSWLTAHAMKAVVDKGGRVVMPAVDQDGMLERVRCQSGMGPQFGSLPNQFVAEVPDGIDGSVAAEGVLCAWKALADAVWERDRLQQAGVDRALWESQVGGFWEIYWVLAPDDDGRHLAMRKNWRSHMPPTSEGDKCTMMGEWQELSGASRPAPARQREFWRRLKKGAGISDIEIRENERLCAIAYIKRRFVHAWEEVKIDGKQTHRGWKLPVSVPSTSYMAAVHWLEKLILAGPAAEPTEAFCKLASSGERMTRIACISKALRHHDAPHLKRLADVDGRALFESDLEDDEKLANLRRRMLESVPDFQEALAPFYAILLMDGDSLGETKAAMKDATALSDALGAFTQRVPEIVREHNGYLVYAGGDDVLAILPIEDALGCASRLRAAYMETFSTRGVPDGRYSISAAVEFAHMKLPLTMILRDAHTLLDDVAKDRTGRNALACRVWKPGGEQFTWAMPWREALEEGRVKIEELAERVGAEETGDPRYANRLLYHMRRTLDLLGSGEVPEDDLRQMLVADYVGSGLLDGVANKAAVASELIAPLLAQCRVYEGGSVTGLTGEAAMLMRFLAQKGVER